MTDLQHKVALRATTSQGRKLEDVCQNDGVMYSVHNYFVIFAKKKNRAKNRSSVCGDDLLKIELIFAHKMIYLPFFVHISEVC